MRKLPGITREDEEKKLQQTIAVADQRLERTRQNVQALADELHEMLETFDESDKEALALWHNTDARFTQVNHELRQAEQARKKPYFGRIDFKDKKIGKKEVYYIGRSAIAENPSEPDVIDWRAPIASVYYDASLGDVTYSVEGEGTYEIELSRKRTYEIAQDKLKDFYDSDVVANDELLTRYLAKNKRAVLSEIIATIQQEQNEVIRRKPQHNLIIQGAAGSGKTTVAMHRISYILYNYELEFAPQDFYIIGSNQVLLNYITGVLPELNVYGVSQMTMEQLFVRLLYEDWSKKYKIKPVRRGITPPIKGTMQWFRDLEDYCERYERSVIPREDVRIEKNGVVLLSSADIEKIWKKCSGLSRADKISRLTDYLTAKLENEITGKYYSYTRDERKRLRRYYETYFGRREWKGSIFELYDDFLREQREKGFSVEAPGKEFDVYDLAALAYFYKRIKEDEIIREAGHLVIDEAQDFGMMAYGSLKYCLSKCTYTIMGDVAQNISLDYGLNDWSQLQELMLPGEFDYFGLLRKSYRNTVEIADFATNILYHGHFSIYPVEPIIRHGKEVRVTGCGSFEALLEQTGETVTAWLRDGLESIAVVCADAEEAGRVTKGLQGVVPLLDVQEESTEFQGGVMVLPLEYTKGLEFDAVLIFDASGERYPLEDGYVKRLYVAATRALHELVVLYQGSLTELIAKPVSEEDKKKAVVQVSVPARRVLPGEPEKTHAEIYRQQAAEAEIEMQDREKYGPKRIPGKAAPEAQSRPQDPAKSLAPGRSSSMRGLAHLQRSLSAQSAKKKEGSAGGSYAGEFGELPDNNALRPVGHSRIDCAVRFVMKGQGYCDILSNYGTLRIRPICPEVIRVCFAKGQCDRFPDPAPEFPEQNVSHKIRESAGTVEILTEKLLVRVDKKTGAIAFLNPQGKILLAERAKEPRLIGEEQCRIFFDWAKEENLIARGIPEAGRLFLEIGNSAKYISFGGEIDQLPALASPRGYELFFPSAGKIFCCNIPMYGAFVAMEGADRIDYYFRVK